METLGIGGLKFKCFKLLCFFMWNSNFLMSAILSVHTLCLFSSVKKCLGKKEYNEECYQCVWDTKNSSTVTDRPNWHQAIYSSVRLVFMNNFELDIYFPFTDIQHDHFQYENNRLNIINLLNVCSDCDTIKG